MRKRRVKGWMRTWGKLGLIKRAHSSGTWTHDLQSWSRRCKPLSYAVLSRGSVTKHDEIDIDVNMLRDQRLSRNPLCLSPRFGQETWKLWSAAKDVFEMTSFRLSRRSTRTKVTFPSPFAQNGFILYEWHCALVASPLVELLLVFDNHSIQFSKDSKQTNTNQHSALKNKP